MLKKKAKNSLISETIKRIIPKRRPSCTAFVCCPSYVPSRTTSRHQKLTFLTEVIRPRIKRVLPPAKLCLCIVRPKTMNSTENPTISGHGLGSTI